MPRLLFATLRPGGEIQVELDIARHPNAADLAAEQQGGASTGLKECHAFTCSNWLKAGGGCHCVKVDACRNEEAEGVETGSVRCNVASSKSERQGMITFESHEGIAHTVQELLRTLCPSMKSVWHILSQRVLMRPRVQQCPWFPEEANSTRTFTFLLHPQLVF